MGYVTLSKAFHRDYHQFSDNFSCTGISLTPGDPTELELREGESLHVSMASLGARLKDATGRTVVTVKTDELEKSFAVCVLSAGKSESTLLDITFEGDEKVTFEVTGKNQVDLVGNFSFDDNDNSDEDVEGLLELQNGSSMALVDSDDDEDEGSTLMADDPPVITEVKETAKAANGHAKPAKGKGAKKGKAAGKKEEKPKVVTEKKTAEKPLAKKAANKKAQQKKAVQKSEEKPSDKVVLKAESKPLQSAKRKMNDGKNETPAKKPKSDGKNAKIEQKTNGDEKMKTPEKKPETPTANDSASKSSKKRKRTKKKGTPART